MVTSKDQSQKSEQSGTDKLRNDKDDPVASISIEDLYAAETLPEAGQQLLNAKDIKLCSEFEELLLNPALRPQKRQPNAHPFQAAKLMPLEFTPVFMNLLRFSDHGSFQSKFTPLEIAQGS